MNGELPELVVQVRLVSAHERKPSFARVAAALAIVAMAVIALLSSCGVIVAPRSARAMWRNAAPMYAAVAPVMGDERRLDGDARGVD